MGWRIEVSNDIVEWLPLFTDFNKDDEPETKLFPNRNEVMNVLSHHRCEHEQRGYNWKYRIRYIGVGSEAS